MNPSIDRVFGGAALGVSVALALVLVVTLAAVAWPRVAGGTGATSATPPEPAYRAGGTIDTPREWHAGSARTLVVIARSDCGACQQARPYLAELVAEAQARGGVVLASPGLDRQAEVAFGREIGLPEEAVKAIPPAGLRATVVPTLVLVDRQGRILGAWEGVPPARQPEIRKAIRAVGAAGPARSATTDLARLIRSILAMHKTIA
jgi:hypothetical protein